MTADLEVRWHRANEYARRRYDLDALVSAVRDRAWGDRMEGY